MSHVPALSKGDGLRRFCIRGARARASVRGTTNDYVDGVPLASRARGVGGTPYAEVGARGIHANSPQPVHVDRRPSHASLFGCRSMVGAYRCESNAADRVESAVVNIGTTSRQSPTMPMSQPWKTGAVTSEFTARIVPALRSPIK